MPKLIVVGSNDPYWASDATELYWPDHPNPKQLLGGIAIADTLKEDARAAVETLHRMGIRTAMVTGDNRRTARAVAERLGIDDVLAEVLPEGKVVTNSLLLRRARLN